MRKYSVKLKKEVLEKVDKISLAQTSREYNIPRTTIQTWVRSFRKVPKSKQPSMKAQEALAIKDYEDRFINLAAMVSQKDREIEELKATIDKLSIWSKTEDNKEAEKELHKSQMLNKMLWEKILEA